jgi:hypothetical protein
VLGGQLQRVDHPRRPVVEVAAWRDPTSSRCCRSRGTSRGRSTPRGKRLLDCRDLPKARSSPERPVRSRKLGAKRPCEPQPTPAATSFGGRGGCTVLLHGEHR